MRTWLFVPGNDDHKIQKALASPADVVIVDWEDGVPAHQKDTARAVSAALLAQPLARRAIIRINSAQTSAYPADVAALAHLPIATVMLPKVEQPAEVVQLANSVGRAIIPLLESALGLERAAIIAGAHAQIERLAFGPLDFLADVGGQWSPEGEALHYARSRLVIASRVAGLPGPIDGVYPQLNDPDGLRRDALIGRRLGFAGKMLLHPAQIAIVRAVFAPTPAEIAQAEQILRAFEEAVAANRSVVSVDGRFVDPPVVRWAQQVLASAATAQDER